MNKFFKNRDGISLIVLIITIIVIIILAASIILSITKNNPITNANKAVVQSDFKTFESELSLYIGDEFLNTSGEFNSLLLYADSSSITYAGTKDTTKNISDIITSLTSTYSSFVEIAGGKIILTSSAPENTATWANEVLPATTTCELKDAPDNIQNYYKFGKCNFIKGSGRYFLSNITISNSDFDASQVGSINSNLKNVIIYNDQVSESSMWTADKQGYYKFIATERSSGNTTLSNSNAWEYLGNSYTITY